MSKLWYRVSGDNLSLVVVVQFPGPQNDQPVILQRIKEVLTSKSINSDLEDLLHEFAQDSIIITALDNLLMNYHVTSVTGIHWNSNTGSAIHILCA